jgi:hypothetical protein
MLAERENIRELATQLPAVWTAPTTTPADRKVVARLLVDDVIATVEQRAKDRARFRKGSA